MIQVGCMDECIAHGQKWPFDDTPTTSKENNVITVTDVVVLCPHRGRVKSFTWMKDMYSHCKGTIRQQSKNMKFCKWFMPWWPVTVAFFHRCMATTYNYLSEADDILALNLASGARSASNSTICNLHPGAALGEGDGILQIKCPSRGSDGSDDVTVDLTLDKR